MNQTSTGFKTDQQMGLFTFYKLQEPKEQTLELKASAYNLEINNNKLQHLTKISIVSQNQMSVIKRKVQSVIDYPKQIEEIETPKVLNRKIKLNKKKLSDAETQAKHSIVDFSFDLSPSRRKNAGNKLYQSYSQRNKTDNVQQQRRQLDYRNTRYFHSVDLIKIKEIKKEEMKDVFKQQRQTAEQQVKLKMRYKREAEKSIVDALQETAKIYNQRSKLNQSSIKNKINKQKNEPLNFLQYLQQKKKKMTEQYKKVRLNKKIGDILNLKLNHNYPFKLKRMVCDRSELAYMIPSCRYPIYQ